MATQVAAKIIGIVAATPPKRGVQRRQAAGCRCGWRQATYDARRKPTVNGASNGDLISSNSIWCLSVCFCFCLCTLHRVPKLLSGLTRHCDDFALNDLKLRCHHWFLFDIIDFLSSIYRLFFFRSIAQILTQIYMNCFVSSYLSWTNLVDSGKFMDNCWISCQFMADMENFYDDLIIINLYTQKIV